MKEFLTKLTVVLSWLIVSALLLIGGSIILIRMMGFTYSSPYTTLILGDSHTQCAIDDTKFPGARNISEPGSTFFYSRTKLRNLLEANPQVNTIILSVHHGSFDIENEESYLYNRLFMAERLPRYIPMMTSDELKTFSGYSELYESAFRIPVEFASFAFKCLRSGNWNVTNYNLGQYSKSDRDKLREDIERRGTKGFPRKLKYSSVELGILKDIGLICREKGVKLILLNTPVYHVNEYTDVSMYDKLVKTELNGFTILNMSQDSIPDSGYGDISHLNDAGAGIFTSHLVEEIKKLN